MNREKQWLLLDRFKRKLFIKFELKKKLCSSIIFNNSLPLSYRYLAAYDKAFLISWSYKSRQKNRCTLTGRGWSIIKKFKLSRFTLREQSYNGVIPALKRSSW